MIRTHALHKQMRVFFIIAPTAAAAEFLTMKIFLPNAFFISHPICILAAYNSKSKKPILREFLIKKPKIVRHTTPQQALHLLTLFHI